MATAQRTPARPAARPAATGRVAPTTPKTKKYSFHDDDPTIVSQHATAPSGAWDSFIASGIPVFRPKEGTHSIRILPRTFDHVALSERFAYTIDPHWALKVFVHKNIGPDRASYLCRRLMLNEYCSLCEERKLSAADAAALKALQAGTRYIAWIIDRKNMSVGPQVWNMPPSQVEQEICKRQEDPDTHKVIKIERPHDGYDVTFEIKKQGDFSVFTGITIKRSPSPISDDPALFAFDPASKSMSGRWADIIHEHPLDSVLRFYDDSYLLQVYNGETSRPDADLDAPAQSIDPAQDGGDPGDGSDTTQANDAGDQGGEGVQTDSAENVTEEFPAPEEILEMDEEALAALCEANNMAFDLADYDNDIGIARDAVIGEFHPNWVAPEPETVVEEPEPAAEPAPPPPRRPAPRARQAAAAPAPVAKPVAAPAKPVSAKPAGTAAEQAAARLKAMRERGAGTAARK